MLIILKSYGLFAQQCNYTLTGKVTDLHDNDPIAGAVLQLEPLGTFKMTDSLGFYFFDQLCAGKYELIVAHPSCDTIRKKVLVRNHVHIPIALEHHIDALEEVIVVDSKQKKITQSVATQQLTAAQLTRYSSQDLASALKNISGVTTLKTGTGIAKPMVHGLYGSRIGIVRNGMRLRDQEWGADHAPTVDLNAFDQVELVKGAAVLQYGGDTPGGLVVMSTSRRLPKDSLFGKMITTGASNGRGGAWAGQLQRTSSNGNFIKLQSSLKRFGDFEAPKYVLSNTGLQQQHFLVELGRTKITKGWDAGYSYFSNRIGILRAAHIGNVSDLARALASDTPLRINPFTYAIGAPQQKSSHQTLTFHAFQWFSDTFKGNLDYNFQHNHRYEFDVRRGNRSDQSAVDLRLKGHELTTHFVWIPNGFWDLNFGVSGLWQDHFANPTTGVKRLIPDYLKYQAGGFVTLTQKQVNKLKVETGLRWDYVFWDAQKYYNQSLWQERNYATLYSNFVQKEFSNQILVRPQLGFSNWAYHMGATLDWHPQWESSFSFIQSQRAPNAAELFSDGLHHSLATIERGALDLAQETIRKMLFHTSYTADKAQWQISAHYAHLLNYIYIAPTTIEQTIRGAFPVWQYTSTESRIWGLDADLSYQFNAQIGFSASASWLRGWDLEKEDYLITIPPVNLYQNWHYKPLRWKRLNFFTEIDLVGAQNRFPDTNFTIDLLTNEGSVTKGIDVSTPPPAYGLVDFGVTLFLSTLVPENNILTITCSNLLNTQYRDYLDRMRFYADAMGRSIQVQWAYKF